VCVCICVCVCVCVNLLVVCVLLFMRVLTCVCVRVNTYTYMHTCIHNMHIQNQIHTHLHKRNKHMHMHTHENRACRRDHEHTGSVLTRYQRAMATRVIVIVATGDARSRKLECHSVDEATLMCATDRYVMSTTHNGHVAGCCLLAMWESQETIVRPLPSSGQEQVHGRPSR
jgi:hypothetical protein